MIISDNKTQAKSIQSYVKIERSQRIDVIMKLHGVPHNVLAIGATHRLNSFHDMHPVFYSAAIGQYRPDIVLTFTSVQTVS